MDEEGTAISEPPEEDRSPQTEPHEVVQETKAWALLAKSFLYVEVASLVLMFACIGKWGPLASSSLAYALSVAVISLIFCLALQTAEYVKPGTLGKIEKPV